jgi:hypothetical protein
MDVFDVLSKTEHARVSLSTISAAVNELLIIGQVRLFMNRKMPSFLERFSARTLESSATAFAVLSVTTDDMIIVMRLSFVPLVALQTFELRGIFHVMVVVRD